MAEPTKVKANGNQKSVEMRSPPKGSAKSDKMDDVWSDDEYYTSAKLGRAIEASKKLKKELFGDGKPAMEKRELELGPEIKKVQ